MPWVTEVTPWGQSSVAPAKPVQSQAVSYIYPCAGLVFSGTSSLRAGCVPCLTPTLCAVLPDFP